MVKLSRKEQEKQARKHAILEAAATLFSENDFHEVTVDEIAERVGLSKGTLYLYFKNKDDLFFSIVRERTQRLFSRLKSAIQADAPYLQRLENLVKTYLGFYEEHQSFFKIIHSEKSRIDVQVQDRLRKHIVQSFHDYIQTLQAFVQEGQAKGLLRRSDPMTLTKMLRGLMDSFTFYWVFMGGEGPLVHEGADIVDLFLNGARAREESNRRTHS